MAIVKDLYKKRLSNNGLTNKLNAKANGGFHNEGTTISDEDVENSLSEQNQNELENTKTWNYQDYQDLINAKTANPKLELQSAMQRAQSASNQYLKALGLQGSGLGQSQLSDISAQYQNALAGITRDAQSQVDSQLNSDLENMVASGKYSQSQIQDFINTYGDKTGMRNSWEVQNKVGSLDFNEEAKLNLDNISTALQNGEMETPSGRKVKLTDSQMQFAKSIYEEMANAADNNDQAKYNELLDKYSSFLNNPNSLSGTLATKKYMQDKLIENERNGNIKVGDKFQMVDGNGKIKVYTYMGEGKYK